MRQSGYPWVNRTYRRRLCFGLRRSLRTHPVRHPVVDNPRAGPGGGVDPVRGGKVFEGASALAGGDKSAAQVRKGVGFPPRQTIMLKGRGRFVEMCFCRCVLALRRSHDRLGALDTTCETKPVLAGANDLAATLKVRQCFTGIADVRGNSGKPGSGYQFKRYVLAVHGNLEGPFQKLHGMVAISGEPAQPGAVEHQPELLHAVPARAYRFRLCGQGLFRELPMTFEE